MNIATLTFHFAHNYGAMLQAYALKKYLSEQGHTVDIAPYYPSWAKKEYAYSPLTSKISIKKRIRFLYQYPVRKKQVNLFETFKQQYLNTDDHLDSTQKLHEYLSSYDAIVYGSDQIWNNNITGNSSEYYGFKNDEVVKIAYAASLGTREINDIQRKYIIDFLPSFKAISVREVQSKGLIETILKRDVDVVCDPVFLLSPDKWESVEKEVSVDPNFMLVYFLKRDENLLQYALRYAHEKNLHPYVIHPTLAFVPNGCTPLRSIGPREFLWLIHNAKCVCTNSFHAVSFSVIFRKKMLHIPNSNSPERTISLLGYLGISIKPRNEIPLYDLEQRDYDGLNNYIRNSKTFLLTALDGVR